MTAMVFYTNNLMKEIGNMWTIIFIVLISLCFLAIIWCITALFWLRRIHRRFTEQIEQPWNTMLEKFKSGIISIEEANKQHGFFNKLSAFSLKEYDRFSPIYFIKHWNDRYDEKWLKERMNKEVSHKRNND